MTFCFVDNGHAAGPNDLEDLIAVVQQPAYVFIHKKLLSSKYPSTLLPAGGRRNGFCTAVR